MPKSFSTKLALWLHDKESPVGHSLRLVFRFLGRFTIEVPSAFSVARFRGLYSVGQRSATAHRRRLERALGSDWETRLSALTNRLPSPWAIRVLVSRSLDVNYCIIVNRGTEPYALSVRSMRLNRHEAFHRWEQVLGGGLMRKLLGNAIQVYEELGIRRILLTAGLSAGGSVWPKFGFRPVTPDAWRKAHARIHKNLRGLAPTVNEQYRASFGSDLSGRVSQILNKSDPTDVWTISDLDEIFPVQIPGYDWGLGSYLLKKTRWHGILDFDDKDAYSRLVTSLHR